MEPPDRTEPRARYGWQSDFPEFKSSDPRAIRERLQSFVRDASPEQVRAWSDSIPPLQREVGEVLLRARLAERYSAIIEYELPMESRRPDVVLLVGDGVLVIELKGKELPSQADIDQAAAYARDLRCYHRECWNGEVVPVLVPTRVKDAMQLRLNAYRVLLTRGRDACVLFVPPLDCLDETWQYFVDIGMCRL